MMVTPCSGVSVEAAGLRPARLDCTVGAATIGAEMIGAGCATVATEGGAETTDIGVATGARPTAGAVTVMLAITIGVGCEGTIAAGFAIVGDAAGADGVAITAT